MLKLIKCEFWKLKRKKLLYALLSLSLFFPLILTYMAKSRTNTDMTEHYLQTRFDYVYTMMLGYGLVFLLPCLIGIIAAILFFIERDCNTSKNIRTIPIANTQLIRAKIYMLFIFGIAFCLINTLSVALFSSLFHAGMVYGMSYKLMMSLVFAVLIVAASLPIVFLIIYFNKTFLLSILLAFFYSIFNWGILGTVGTSISASKITFLNFFPVICVMNWASGSMMNNLQKDNLLPEAYDIVPTTSHTVLLMVITVTISLWLIVRFYKKWTR
ncbi:ABC transporter permease [Clostridioides sp. ES-S-0001-03]|uniref:ABC transporter permease n=1 Tax=Clostridioides sp. ES-S-0001-03 TaxID=2770771 RepID=UPI001D0C647A|nr:ABC transporter permease [Clostridioides sp. ES-S-0001-03]UDN60153.1 ABC transporter permease [Clostridioides sp. ES-S-0010-02]